MLEAALWRALFCSTLSRCRSGAVRAYTPQREQTSRSCQSGTGVSLPYRAAISAGSGLDLMLDSGSL
jgi:hypothetical protein